MSVSSWPPDSASLFGLDLGHYRVDANGLEQHPVEEVEGLGRHDVHADPGHRVQSLLKLRPQLGLEVGDTSVKTLDNIVQLIWEVCPFRPRPLPFSICNCKQKLQIVFDFHIVFKKFSFDFI